MESTRYYLTCTRGISGDTFGSENDLFKFEDAGGSATSDWQAVRIAQNVYIKNRFDGVNGRHGTREGPFNNDNMGCYPDFVAVPDVERESLMRSAGLAPKNVFC